MSIDGNLAALARHEKELDRLQKMDDSLDALIDEIWDNEDMLVLAINAAPSVDMPISDAIEHHARELLKERERRDEV
jgi:hypothetical protein